MWSLFFLGDLHEARAIAPAGPEPRFAMGRGIILAYRGRLREAATELLEAGALARQAAVAAVGVAALRVVLQQVDAAAPTTSQHFHGGQAKGDIPTQ